MYTQSDTMYLEKVFVYLQAKNELYPQCFSGGIAGHANYFGYFGHAWLQTPKMIASACRRFQCLFACQK